jgi:gas vesicle protein
MKGVLSFIVGAILGALVGASLAMLLAPMSGEELRGEIDSRARYISDEMRIAAQQRREELERQLEQLRAPRRSGDIQVQ